MGGMPTRRASPGAGWKPLGEARRAPGEALCVRSGVTCRVWGPEVLSSGTPRAHFLRPRKGVLFVFRSDFQPDGLWLKLKQKSLPSD